MSKAIAKKMAILQKQFPKAWFKDGGEFSNRYEQTIWTGEGSDLHDPEYGFDVSIFKWDMTIHPLFEKALDQLDLWAEHYDAGTVFIYSKSAL